MTERRIRDRRNVYGRRDGGNRCGHDPNRRPRVAQPKSSLPRFLKLAISNVRGRALPMLLGRARRSELQEATAAVASVMLARTDIASGRIGRPGRHRQRFDGLTVDHHLAPLSGVSESRIERLLGTWEDWGWLHWRQVPCGRRRARRGYLRCAAQPIETLPDGRRRGLAAVRVWTDAFWQWLGAVPALAEARELRARERAAATGLHLIPVGDLVDQLAARLGHPDAAPRGPP